MKYNLKFGEGKMIAEVTFSLPIGIN